MEYKKAQNMAILKNKKENFELLFILVLQYSA